jgi:hypothetical protein
VPNDDNDDDDDDIDKRGLRLLLSDRFVYLSKTER